jgi:hypothetical protein
MNGIESMSHDVANLILEELSALRCGQDGLRWVQAALCADIADVKISATRSEATPRLAMNLIGYLQMQIASQTSRIDRFDERIGRIERSLEAGDTW